MNVLESESVGSQHGHSVTCDALLRELRGLESEIVKPALAESIRLIESDKFDQLTDQHIREISEYRAIELDEETFFDRAFSPGKQAAASLAFAQLLGRDVVLHDLQRLRASLGQPELEE